MEEQGNNNELVSEETRFFDPKDVLAQTPKSVTWKFFKFLGTQNSADKTKVICSKHPPYYPVGFIIVLLCFCCLHFVW